MIQIITILISLVALGLIFIVAPIWSWAPILLADLFIIFQFVSVRKAYKVSPIPTLSEEANALWMKYGHYFSMPLASRDFSASAAILQFVGVAVAILCAFKDFYWGIGLAVANWFLMGTIAVGFTPAALLAKIPSLRQAHDEVVNFIQTEKRTET